MEGDPIQNTVTALEGEHLAIQSHSKSSVSIFEQEWEICCRNERDSILKVVARDVKNQNYLFWTYDSF